MAREQAYLCLVIRRLTGNRVPALTQGPWNSAGVPCSGTRAELMPRSFNDMRGIAGRRTASVPFGALFFGRLRWCP